MQFHGVCVFDFIANNSNKIYASIPLTMKINLKKARDIQFYFYNLHRSIDQRGKKWNSLKTIFQKNCDYVIWSGMSVRPPSNLLRFTFIWCYARHKVLEFLFSSNSNLQLFERAYGTTFLFSNQRYFNTANSEITKNSLNSTVLLE